jgi:glycyl-tRNA synthetase beta chain
MAKKASNGAESLLVELLTEELPPKALRPLSEAFMDRIFNDLVKRQLHFRDTRERRVFATPRRLAVLIPDVEAIGEDRETEIVGPPATLPKQAIEGFAKKHGVSVDSLGRQATSKGEVVVARIQLKGQVLDQVLAHVVEGALKSLPIPKMMRWGAGDAQFVRPVHGLVMLHGTRVVPGTVFGLTSGRKTQGHRFMSKGEITLTNAEEYEAKLREPGGVIADFAARRSEIDTQLKAAAKREKALLGAYEDLLYEVTALVELPAVYAGHFDASFLDVPQECLILTMRQNQKYFPLFDATNRLLPKFLIVSNMQVTDPRHIIGGNERVIRPRLEDARFFFDQDRKQPLRERVDKLATVVYYREKLGSQLDRVKRIKSLSERIAAALNVDANLVGRAAYLCKADLLTAMVGEFPELQGVMGRYYALNDNEPEEVANAIDQHYRPRFAGDRLPEGPVACVLALADKLETIAGMFAVGQQPTGEKDPFALRRHALGVVRILIEKKISIGVAPLVDLAIGELPKDAFTDWAPIVEFVLDRARTYFADKGFPVSAIEAVLRPFGAQSPLYMLLDTVEEASRFIGTEEGKILAEANKRITNILRKSGFEVPFGLLPHQLAQKPNTSLFKESAEVDFWAALTTVGVESLNLRSEKRFAESLRVLSRLGGPTKSFFDKVLVNAEEPEVRDNRITLLQHARAYMNQVADLSLMAQ